LRQGRSAFCLALRVQVEQFRRLRRESCQPHACAPSAHWSVPSLCRGALSGAAPE
jgi:hypothetical protein